MSSTGLKLTFDISSVGFTSEVDGNQADADAGHQHKEKYQKLLQGAHLFLLRCSGLCLIQLCVDSTQRGVKTGEL